MAEREEKASRLEAEIADAFGVLNAAAGRLASLLSQVVEAEIWEV